MTELYTLKMAQKDFNGSNGLELSLKKWESIRNALYDAGGVGYRRCGLCLEAPHCPACPYYKHHGHSCMDAAYEATSAIETALNHARKVLDLLRQVGDAEKSQTAS